MESQFNVVSFFLYYDRYSCKPDLAKIKIVTFALKIINSKNVSKTTFTRWEFIRVNVETDKNLSLFACCV